MAREISEIVRLILASSLVRAARCLESLSLL